jgi:hypothetical protein
VHEGQASASVAAVRDLDDRVRHLVLGVDGLFDVALEKPQPAAVAGVIVDRGLFRRVPVKHNQRVVLVQVHQVARVQLVLVVKSVWHLRGQGVLKLAISNAISNKQFRCGNEVKQPTRTHSEVGSSAFSRIAPKASWHSASGVCSQTLSSARISSCKHHTERTNERPNDESEQKMKSGA